MSALEEGKVLNADSSFFSVLNPNIPYLPILCLPQIKQSFAGKFLEHSSRIPAKLKLGLQHFEFLKKPSFKVRPSGFKCRRKICGFRILASIFPYRRGYFFSRLPLAHIHDCDRLLSKRGQILKLWVTSLFFSLMRSPFFPSPDPFRICLC